MLYIAFEGDDSAIQWCQFCVSLSGSLFNILQLFASFSQNPTSTTFGGRYVLDRLFDNLTDKSY